MRNAITGSSMLALAAVLAVGGCSKKNNEVDTTMGTSGGSVAPATPNAATTDTMNGHATGNPGAAAAGTGTAGPGTPGTSSMSPSTGASTAPSTGTPGTGPGTTNDSTTRNRTGSGPGSGTGSKGSGSGSTRPY